MICNDVMICEGVWWCVVGWWMWQWLNSYIRPRPPWSICLWSVWATSCVLGNEKSKLGPTPLPSVSLREVILNKKEQPHRISQLRSWPGETNEGNIWTQRADLPPEAPGSLDRYCNACIVNDDVVWKQVKWTQKGAIDQAAVQMLDLVTAYSSADGGPQTESDASQNTQN